MLNPQESLGRDQKEGGGAGLRKLDFFLLRLLLNSSAADIVLVPLLRTAVERAIAWYTSCYAMARGHRLNMFVVLEAVHGLLGLPGRSARSEPSLFLPPSPVPNKPPRVCGRKAKRLLTSNLFFHTAPEPLRWPIQNLTPSQSRRVPHKTQLRERQI